MNFNVNDQVVVRRKVNRSGPRTNEVRIGSIVELSATGEQATVSLPLPGGSAQRVTIPTSSLEPVKSQFGRDRVQLNPIHRQIGRPIQ